jgi:hypothetical protein
VAPERAGEPTAAGVVSEDAAASPSTSIVRDTIRVITVVTGGEIAGDALDVHVAGALAAIVATIPRVADTPMPVAITRPAGAALGRRAISRPCSASRHPAAPIPAPGTLRGSGAGPWSWWGSGAWSWSVAWSASSAGWSRPESSGPERRRLRPVEPIR